MKIEIDESYCCGHEMKRRTMVDIETKNEVLMFICQYCKHNFQLSKSLTMYSGIKTKTTSF